MQFNLRAEKMAAIILDRYDFQDKTVVDFGSGYGDMMNYALGNGARYALGVDKKQSNVNTATRKNEVYGNKCAFYRADFENEGVFDNILDIASGGASRMIDVAFCFSVLPYLESPTFFIYKLGSHFRDVFIEAQYTGDGPGHFALDDKDMSLWLRERGFDVAMLIGQTLVEGREKQRSIWHCYRWENRDE